MELQTFNCNLMPQSVRRVFDIPELREIIITLAIFQPQNDSLVLCRQTAKSLRLLSKAWLTSVSKLVQIKKFHLFKLVLSKNETNVFVTLANGQVYLVQQNIQVLDYFIQAYTAPYNQQCPPTFILEIKEEFFHQPENYISFRNFLLKCGKGLIKLVINVPSTGGFQTCIFPPYQLPRLKELKVKYNGTQTNYIENSLPANMLHDFTSNFIHLISSLLNASTSLDHLVFPICNLVPNGFELLTFPETLTQLCLNCEMKSNQLEILTMNRLPNLSLLALYMPVNPFTDGLMYRVLNTFRTFLRSLILRGNKAFGIQRTCTKIRFPIMQNLENLYMDGTTFELEPQTEMFCFPRLKRLTMRQSITEFLKFTENPVYLEVAFVDICLYHNILPANGQTIMNINLEEMQLLHRAFPNVRSLTLALSGDESSGLKYLLKEMRQLKILKVMHLDCDMIYNSDFWDALLTGVTEGLIAALRVAPELSNVVAIQGESLASIRNLTELESLSLETVGDDNNPYNYVRPLISDLAFTYGLLKTSNLRVLNLKGRFQASTRMENMWKERPDSVINNGQREIV